jgi:hypothetical protein
MKTLLTILTISKLVNKSKKPMKRSIFTLSQVVVELTTLLAKTIILPFTLYKYYKKYKQSKTKIAPPKNVVSFSDYKKKRKVS